MIPAAERLSASCRWFSSDSCSVALGVRNYSGAVPAIEWVRRAAPYAAALGLVVFAAALGVRELGRRRTEEYLALYRAEETRKDATLRGLARAAWLLQRGSSIWEI
jgi:hypothetical protein